MKKQRKKGREEKVGEPDLLRRVDSVHKLLECINIIHVPQHCETFDSLMLRINTRIQSVLYDLMIFLLCRNIIVCGIN